MSTGKTGPALSLTRVQTQVHNYFKIDEAWGGGVTCSIALMTALLYPDNSKLCRYSQAVGFLTEEFLPAFEAIDLLRPDGHDVIRYVPGGGDSPTTYSRHRTTRKRRKNTRTRVSKDSSQASPNSCLCQIRSSNFKVRHRHPQGTLFPTFPSHRHATLSTSNRSQPRFNHETLRRKPRLTERKRLGRRGADVAMGKKHRNDGARSHRGNPP